LITWKTNELNIMEEEEEEEEEVPASAAAEAKKQANPAESSPTGRSPR
jgi:hypothetical protein